ncbi:hypothetical protein Fcan01_17717 [Folsomia candida]|uniref:Uncharacterized protein n=1 Tax=Folsomia candida TaxID=158441 RepID=A0A226DQH0_FOLCA|nr:hypothetical protein Fcan01_17717 [Folsomia candida]
MGVETSSGIRSSQTKIQFQSEVMFRHFNSEGTTFNLFFSLMCTVTIVYTLSGFCISSGEVYLGSGVPSGFTRMLELEKDLGSEVLFGRRPSASPMRDLLACLALQNAVILHICAGPAAPLVWLYLGFDPFSVISPVGFFPVFNYRQTFCIISKLIIYFLVCTDIARNMSYVIHFQLIILTKYFNILSMLRKTKKNARQFEKFMARYEHFFIVYEKLGGGNDNAVFFVMWHALVLVVILLFVIIRMYGHMPFMIYQFVVATALNIGMLLKISIPFFTNLWDSSTLLLHQWRGVSHNCKYLKKKFKSLRPIGFKVACGDVVLFVMEN